jgi:hypothetical protein
MPECSDRYVVLRGGVPVEVEALRLAWSLEDRGFTFELAGSDLCVRPGSALTADDVALIKAHKSALLTVVAYCENLGDHVDA